VRGLRTGTVLVSHDRAFLERTVHRVLELDLAQQQVRLYGGGYLAYRQERQIAREHAREAYEKYAGTRAGLQERMRTQIGWADKGVRQARAKATDNDKHIVHRQVARSEKLAGKVKATERMLDRLDVVAEPRKEWQLKMEIAAAPRSGTVAATLRDAVIERGGFRLGPVSLQVNWADRIAITGPNGAGKCSFTCSSMRARDHGPVFVAVLAEPHPLAGEAPGIRVLVLDQPGEPHPPPVYADGGWGTRGGYVTLMAAELVPPSGLVTVSL